VVEAGEVVAGSITEREESPDCAGQDGC